MSFSVNLTYYNEPQWLEKWYNTIKQITKRGIDIRLNICDDGSQTEPASDYFEKRTPLSNMRLFRVVKDIGFNSHGARNLLMSQTETDWNLNSDIDRKYPHLEAIAQSVDLMNEGEYYSFWETIQSSPDRYSVNDYIVHKNDFWKTGGYDEEFVNIHFGDRYFLDALRMVTSRVKVREWEVIYARKARKVTFHDGDQTIYPNEHELIHPQYPWGDETFRFQLKDFVKKRNMTHEGRMSKKVIQFEWERVF